MASRKEQKERLRQERLQREAEAAIAVVALGGGGSSDAEGETGAYPKGSVPPQRITNLEAAVTAAGCELKNPPIQSNGHTTSPVTYRSNPPTSGNHNPTPADDRKAYTEAPPTEMLVHALEHGRIIVQFAPSVPASVKGDLKALFDEQKIGMILTPNETSETSTLVLAG